MKFAKTKNSVIRKASLLCAGSVFIAACGGETYDVSFREGIHQRDTAFTLKIEAPSGAENIYLTTDNQNPTNSESCKFDPAIIDIAKPTVVKLRYDLDGKTVISTGIYVVADAIEKNRFANRVAIDIFESFITRHINPSFGPSPTAFDETKTINDGAGGTATRDTIIEGIIFKNGKQTFTFDNYKYHDADNDTLFIAKSGKIFGYMDSDGGYYNTDVDGETMVYSGTYNGHAEGHFYLNENSQTTSGFYRTTCVDRWCADHEVYYVMDTNREFVEVPGLGKDVRSCD